MNEAATIELGSGGVAAGDVVGVAREGIRAELSDQAREAMAETAAVVDRLAASEEPAYGVSTGFGSLAQTAIPAERRIELQRALIRSHAAGMGPPVEREVVRAMFFLRARSLAMGRSGARPVLVETMLAMLAAGLDPVVPEHGSLGASGDLAPLAHCALALIGEGEVLGAGGEAVPAGEALRARGADPARSRPQGGPGADQRHRRDPRHAGFGARRPGARCCASPTSPAAASTEALLGTDRAFAADLVALRPQPGQAESAANLAPAARRLGDRRQPPRRTTPGSRTPTRSAARRRSTARRATRTPTSTGRRARARRRDRQPDGAARRPGRVLRQLPRRPGRDSPATSSRSPPPRSARSPSGAPTGCSTARARTACPPFLAPDAGVDSGLMIAQYTQAAMVAENRRLAAPAAVDSLPTSAMQEDHVSMGWGAARKLRTRDRQPAPDPRGRAHLRRARARAARAARAGRGHRRRARCGARGGVPGAGPDRWLAPELAAVEELLASGALLAAVEDRIGGMA